MNEHPACIDGPEGCQGPVEYRPAPPTGERSFARCEHHQDIRWDRYEASDLERYAHSDIAPDWFDPSYAGERWEDD